MSDIPVKTASVTADPANQEKLAEEMLGNMDKGMPTFLVKGGGLWELWATATELSQYRLNRYRDYDEMCQDSLIASAMELVSDDACQFSADRGCSVWPAKGSDQEWILQTLRNLAVEDNIWGWTHNTALYGDFFPQLIVAQDEKEKSGFKFKSLDSSIHPQSIRRLDIDGKLAGFLSQEEFGEVKNHAPWEFVHFMLNNRPRFERHKLRIKRASDEEDKPQDFTPTQSDRGDEVIATSMYGTSWLDPARHVYRVLKLLEQSLALARLNRSPLIRVFYINTTGMTPKERKDTLDALHQRFKQSLSMDMRQNFYKSDYNPLSYNADLFIPVTDGVGSITAETLGGELNIKDIVDVDYQKNKLFAALRIPQAYLGFEEAMPGALGSTTLVRLDIRYARSVKKIQRAMLSGVTRLLEIMYALERGERPDPKKIAIEMEVISGIEELDRMEGLEKKLGVAQSFLQMTAELEGKIDRTPIIKYVFNTVLGMKDMTKELKIGEMPAEEPGDKVPPEGPQGSGGDDTDFTGADWDKDGEASPMLSSVRELLGEAIQKGKIDPSVAAPMIEALRRERYIAASRRTMERDFSTPSHETRAEYDLLADVVKEQEDEEAAAKKTNEAEEPEDDDGDLEPGRTKGEEEEP